MGYSLFANRKIYYTNLVFNIQSQIDNIMQQKMSMLNYSANISDGIVSVEEMASDPENIASYKDFLLGAQEYKEGADGAADAIQEIGSYALEQNDSEEYLAAVASMLDKAVNEKYAEQCAKKIEALENELDMKQKRLETQLSVAQQQLQAVEEAEGKAIEQSTPKYNGVG